MAASLLVKAQELQEKVAAVSVVSAARQDAARLDQRLGSLQTNLAELRRAQTILMACRAVESDIAIGRPATDRLAHSINVFLAAISEQGDIDQVALSLGAALNALRDDMRTRVAAWWQKHAPARIRDAGAEAIDLLEPSDQAAARALIQGLREAIEPPPRIPADIIRFNNDLASLTELVAENQVADLPESLRDVLRSVGARRMRLSDLTSETLETLKATGYADRLSVYWDAS